MGNYLTFVVPTRTTPKWEKLYVKTLSALTTTPAAAMTLLKTFYCRFFDLRDFITVFCKSAVDAEAATKWLKSLRFWRGDGRNHLLVYLSRQTTVQNPLVQVDTGRALVAQSNFLKEQFRYGFDIALSTIAAFGVAGKMDISGSWC